MHKIRRKSFDFGLKMVSVNFAVVSINRSQSSPMSKKLRSTTFIF